MRMPALMARLGEWIGRMVDEGMLEQSAGDYCPERRRHPRYKPTTMKWRMRVPGFESDGILDNISVGGACIRCGSLAGGRLPKPGATITVEFPQPGPDTLHAEVVAVSSVDGDTLLHLAWSLDQEFAVERVNSLLQHASR